MKNLVERLVPERPSAHADPPSSRSGDGDARARLRRALPNQSVAVAVSDGKLVLGRFQSIILTELAGPGRREVMVHVIGE